MAKSKITVEHFYNESGEFVVQVKKARGKLTIDEIAETLTRSSEGLEGMYTLILRCTGEALEGNCYMDDEDPGDAATLYRLEEDERCPVCGRITPPFEYCPACGEKWRDHMKK